MTAEHTEFFERVYRVVNKYNSKTRLPKQYGTSCSLYSSEVHMIEVIGGHGKITATQLSACVPITGLSCKPHKINVENDNISTARITLADPSKFAGNRDFILDYTLTGEDFSSGLMLGTGETGAAEPNLCLRWKAPSTFLYPKVYPAASSRLQAVICPGKKRYSISYTRTAAI